MLLFMYFSVGFAHRFQIAAQSKVLVRSDNVWTVRPGYFLFCGVCSLTSVCTVTVKLARNVPTTAPLGAAELETFLSSHSSLSHSCKRHVVHVQCNVGHLLLYLPSKQGEPGPMCGYYVD